MNIDNLRRHCLYWQAKGTDLDNGYPYSEHLQDCSICQAVEFIREQQERIADLESTVEAYRENRAGQYKRKLDAALEALEDLRDTLHNGIKYDERLNCYVMVWTERQIENARKEADAIIERIEEMK